MDVRILGKTYALRHDQDASLVLEAAALIDDLAKELQSKMGPIPVERAAVLIAMNLAGDLLRLRKAVEGRQAQLAQEVDQLIARLESPPTSH